MAQCGSRGDDPHGSGSAAGAEDWHPQTALPPLLCGRVALNSQRVSHIYIVVCPDFLLQWKTY